MKPGFRASRSKWHRSGDEDDFTATADLLGYDLVASDDDSVNGSSSGFPRSRGGGLNLTCLRQHASAVLCSKCFQVLTVVCIVANAVVIGCETDMPGLKVWNYLEAGFLALFSLELACRLFVHGVRAYFCGKTQKEQQVITSGLTARRRPIADSSNLDVVWNLFDFMIVGSGLGNLLMECVASTAGSQLDRDTTLFRVVRLLRILRVLRLLRVIRFLKQLYLLAYGFIEGAMAVFWVAILASAVIYLCSIILVRSYGQTTPEQEDHDFFSTHFYSVPGAMFTLFEIMSSPNLKSYRTVMGNYPLLTMFIIVFVLFGSFGMNGLLTGVISESIIDKNQARIEEQRSERELKRRILEQCSAELFEDMDQAGDGNLRPEDLLEYKEEIGSLFHTAGVAFPHYDFEHMFKVMDYNDNGTIEKPEFVHGILELCEEVRPMSIMEIHSQVSRCHIKIERCDSKVGKMDEAMYELLESCRVGDERSHDLLGRLRDLLEGGHAKQAADGQQGVERCEALLNELRTKVEEMSSTAAQVRAKGIVLPTEAQGSTKGAAVTGVECRVLAAEAEVHIQALQRVQGALRAAAVSALARHCPPGAGGAGPQAC